MPSSLVTAFRQQFPEGSILSELLTLHDGLFIVRVSVMVRGTPLSQALGSNTSLELAEDIACNRALERLELNAPQAHQQPLSSATPQPSPEHQPPAHSSPTVLDAEKAVPANHSQKIDLPTGELSETEEPTLFAPAEADPPLPEKTDEFEGNPAKPSPAAAPQGEKFPNLKLATPPSPEPPKAEPPTAVTDLEPWIENESTDFSKFSADPVDLSDIIAQTDVELQRLGWDVHQGREFLEKTYGKRSRHDLTDEELLEFLLYLESQPTPSVS